MNERCRCGAELLPAVHFCVGCGADRELVGVGVAPEARASRHRRPSPPSGWAAPTGLDAPASWAPRAERDRDALWAAAPTTDTFPVVPAAPPRPAGTRTGVARSAAHRPASPSGTPWPWLVGCAIVVIVAVLAVAAAFVLRPSAVAAPAAAPAVPAAVPAAAAEPVDTVTPAVAGPRPSYPSVPTGAASRLQAQVAADNDAVESLTGYWVPQVFSRKAGMSLEGHIYTGDDIVTEFAALRSVYPDAALLWSGDWPVFTSPDYYVAIVARPFLTATEANAWCDAQGYGSDDCFAKNLSHTGGPQGTTVHR